MENLNSIDFEAVNQGFGQMADIYDGLQETNAIVNMMRQKFYNVILGTVCTPAGILELNCGSGIDAHFLADKGYKVLATDVSEKMLNNAILKGYKNNLTFKQLNFNELDKIDGDFDLIISNFGGLNCYNDLSFISAHTARLLKPGGYFIATVMPRISFWELALVFKGEFKRGFRRLKEKGTMANVGDKKIFVKYYHPTSFYNHFRNDYKLISTKTLSVFFPPPTALNWFNTHPKFSSLLYKMDLLIENLFISAFCGDYYIAVLQKKEQ
jgi:2-polyprenyl-3-methyl-5-hydroxy-6-metoxy-1,4-benzoquinol methylase